MEEHDNSNIPEENFNDDEDNLSDISNNINNLENTDSNILRSLLNELVKINHKDMWSCISPRMLYKYYLADANAIAESFVHSELTGINKIFKQYTA